LFGFVGALPQPALHDHPVALGQGLGDVFGGLPPQVAAQEQGLAVAPLTGRLVVDARGRGDREARDRHTVRGEAQLRVGGQVPDHREHGFTGHAFSVSRCWAEGGVEGRSVLAVLRACWSVAWAGSPVPAVGADHSALDGATGGPDALNGGVLRVVPDGASLVLRFPRGQLAGLLPAVGGDNVAPVSVVHGLVVAADAGDLPQVHGMSLLAVSGQVDLDQAVFVAVPFGVEAEFGESFVGEFGAAVAVPDGDVVGGNGEKVFVLDVNEYWSVVVLPDKEEALAAVAPGGGLVADVFLHFE